MITTDMRLKAIIKLAAMQRERGPSGYPKRSFGEIDWLAEKIMLVASASEEFLLANRSNFLEVQELFD